jgi:2-polyprenyl-3-methyl-5-hydroxy-6-metoxy-1,4-benzoquinol methylase
LISRDQYENLNITYDAGTIFGGLDDRLLREVLAVDDRKATLAPYISLFKHANPTFLDIGCGHGEAMVAAREMGCICLGIEPSAAHSQIGKERFHLDIINSYFGSGVVGERKFDIVHLSQVIEHIYDVRKFVHDLAQVVAPGGVIIMVTPNAGSFAALLTRKYWTMLKTPDHVTMLTAEGARKLTPPGFECRITTGEFRWESLITMLQGVRDYFRERNKSTMKLPSHRDSGDFTTKRYRYRRLLGIATIASWPLHFLGGLLDRRCTLVISFHHQMAENQQS